MTPLSVGSRAGACFSLFLTLKLAYAFKVPLRPPLKYLGLLYDWRQSRFLLCTWPDVYRPDLATDRLSIRDWSRATATAPSLWWVIVSVIESSFSQDQPAHPPPGLDLEPESLTVRMLCCSVAGDWP
jgi:hypothetical protein